MSGGGRVGLLMTIAAIGAVLLGYVGEAAALAIIVVLFPLALTGVLGLAGVVFVHAAAEVIVILNGIRAARPARVKPHSNVRKKSNSSNMPLRFATTVASD
jgi:hypothetical protein